MVESAQVAEAGGREPGPIARMLWYRQLERYPNTGPRYFYLLIVVVATIMLYYQFYVQGAVAPQITSQLHMSFPFFVYIVVISNALGAFGSLFAGLADRWGRANLVAYGLVFTGAMIAFGVPNSPNKYAYLIMFSSVGFVEGIMLVATPALVRDYSPQVGRASAMGFWTLGPVIGSLIVAEVSSRTVNHIHFWYSAPTAAGLNRIVWQDQYVICGLIGLLVAAIAVLFLKELSPNLRDQLMVSLRDRALVEARARGLDLGEALRHPWRQMMHLDIVGSAAAISVFLIVYYTLIGFSVLYFVFVFNFTTAQANSLGVWIWAFDAIALVGIGVLSDKVRVRKPFMAMGALGAIAMTSLFAYQTYNIHTGYYTFVWILSLMAIFLGFAFSPWMASFTETVEKRNPALIATGLAVWGWIIRAIVSISIFILPYVVTTMTPLFENGPRAQAIQAQFPAQVATLTKLNAVGDPQTLAALKVNSNDPVAGLKAANEYSKAYNVPLPQAITQLQGIQTLPPSDLTFLSANGTQLTNAQAASPREWRTWWWVCVGTEVAFIPFIFVMTGRWSPRRAKRDEQEHQQLVERELQALGTPEDVTTAQA
ncbi:MAG TPA: MFS transporter [Acidimicrobiales bacterium]|jgi:MFS family permease